MTRMTGLVRWISTASRSFRLTDRAFRGVEAARVRARATAGLSGEVLEAGSGPGLTVPSYPPAVTRVRAAEPSAVARKLAAAKVAAMSRMART